MGGWVDELRCGRESLCIPTCPQDMRIHEFSLVQRHLTFAHYEGGVNSDRGGDIFSGA